jgi:hypothetical protein
VIAAIPSDFRAAAGILDESLSQVAAGEVPELYAISASGDRAGRELALRGDRANVLPASPERTDELNAGVQLQCVEIERLQLGLQ